MQPCKCRDTCRVGSSCCVNDVAAHVFECRQVGFVKLVLTMKHSSAFRALFSSLVHVSLVVVDVSLQQHASSFRISTVGDTSSITGNNYSRFSFCFNFAAFVILGCFLFCVTPTMYSCGSGDGCF